MEASGGLLNKLKDLGPDLCVYFLENYLENEKSCLATFHTIPTALLRDQQTYTKGLLVLNTFLNYCTSEDLNKAGSSWMTPLMKHISLDMSTSCSVELSYTLLGKIITKSSDAKELVKTIGATYLSRLVLNLVDTPKNCHLVALHCLSSCLIHYGGHCSPLQSRIEQFILSFVDSHDEKLTREAGRCLLLMQQLAGGGVHGVNHHKSWGRLQNRLLGSLSETLSSIFENDLTQRDSTEGETSLILPAIDMSAGPLKRIVDLIQRFKNLTSFFNVALLGPYKTTKPVQPVKILKLISRAVEALGNTARNSLTLEDVVTVNILPSMHESVLALLKALIALLRGNMVLFSRSVCSILLSSLKCSAKSASLRIATYQLFVFWCNTVNTSSCVEDISDTFIKSIVRDTKPFVVKVQLQVNGTSAKNKPSKRLKRKLGESLEKQEETDGGEIDCERHLNSVKYEKLCCEALNCLRQLIRCGSCFMKLHQMKHIYEHTMSLIVQNVEIDQKKRPLYANRDCRQSLFLVLKELLVSAFTITLPQSQFLIHVFSQAQNSEPWHDIRTLCVEIIGDLDRVIHPQKFELKFPPKEEAIPMKLTPDNHVVDDAPMNVSLVSDEEEKKEKKQPEIPEVMNEDIMPNIPESFEIDDEDFANKVMEDENRANEEQEKAEVVNDKTPDRQDNITTTTEDIVLEIDSNDSAQELSDEEIVFTPVVTPQSNNIPDVEEEDVRVRNKPIMDRRRAALIILDDDSDDEMTNLIDDFVDDVNP